MPGDDVILLIVVLGVAAALYWDQHQKGKRRQALLEEYQAALAALKKSPSDSKLRSKVLDIGRAMRLAEPAITNDITQATAALSTPPPASPEPIETRLARLESLLSSGAISQTEHDSRRQKLLDEV